jgi:hypothetical protein
MRTGAYWVLSLGLLLVTLGCGEPPPPATTVTKEKHEAIWKDLIKNFAKKKSSAADRQKVLTKHKVSEEEWNVAELAYGGVPESLKASYEKAMGMGRPVDGKPPPLIK